MGSFSTVDCCEVAGSRQESQSRDGFDASVQLRAAWADRVALFNDLPDHPWPDESSAIVVGMTMKPEPGHFTEDGQEIVPEYVLFDVKYSNNMEKKEEPDTISETIEKSVEFLTLDYRKFRWNEATGKSLLEAEAPGLQMFTINLVRTHYKVPSPISAAVLDLAGRCNQAAYTSALLGKTFAVETLLYTGPGLDRTITRTGPGPWTIKLVFGYKPQEWNRFWHPDTGTWDQIWSLELGAIYKNYPPADLSGLLY